MNWKIQKRSSYKQFNRVHLYLTTVLLICSVSDSHHYLLLTAINTTDGMYPSASLSQIVQSLAQLFLRTITQKFYKNEKKNKTILLNTLKYFSCFTDSRLQEINL